MRDAEVMNDWERMRLLAAISIQPHIKKKITAQKLVPLPWDRKKEPVARNGEAKKLTVEQHRQRAKELESRFNGNK